MFIIGLDAIQIHLDELAACNLPRSVGTMPIVEDPKLSPCLPISSLCQYSQQRPTDLLGRRYGFTRCNPVKAATPTGTRIQPASRKKVATTAAGNSKLREHACPSQILTSTDLSEGAYCDPTGTSTGRNWFMLKARASGTDQSIVTGRSVLVLSDFKDTA